MEKFNSKLWIWLIPSKSAIKNIYDLTNDISKIYDLSFFLKQDFSIPHLTLFQGKFTDEEMVIKLVREIDFSSFKREQFIKWISLWAKKILFLDCRPSNDLQIMHEQIYNKLFPICEWESADSQNFEDITNGQQKSFEETWYPFSLCEYLPHFTLAHILDLPQDINDIILKESNIGTSINFDRLVIYKVGDLGRCTDLIYEKKI